MMPQYEQGLSSPRPSAEFGPLFKYDTDTFGAACRISVQVSLVVQRRCRGICAQSLVLPGSWQMRTSSGVWYQK